jgi:hypothetical protein
MNRCRTVKKREQSTSIASTRELPDHDDHSGGIEQQIADRDEFARLEMPEHSRERRDRNPLSEDSTNFERRLIEREAFAGL